MHARYKRLGLVAVLVLILLVAILSRRNPSATSSAIGMTFLGYTNLPGNDLRFALFSASNQAAYAIRWRGDWVEVEGSQYFKARTVNSSLPGNSYEPVLKGGQSLMLAVGEPFNASETGRWRFAMSFTRYAWRERWLDFSLRHKLPLGFGPVLLIDAHRILDPSNNVTASTAWLAK